MEQKLDRQAQHRLAILRHAEEVTGNVAQTCRYYGISRPTFYKWLRRYQDEGITGPRDARACRTTARTPPTPTSSPRPPRARRRPAGPSERPAACRDLRARKAELELDLGQPPQALVPADLAAIRTEIRHILTSEAHNARKHSSKPSRTIRTSDRIGGLPQKCWQPPVRICCRSPTVRCRGTVTIQRTEMSLIKRSGTRQQFQMSSSD